MRNLIVIKEFLELNKKIIIISGKKQLKFLRIYLSSTQLNVNNCVFIEMNNDFGLRVRKDFLKLDYDKISNGVESHLKQFPDLIELGKKIIEKYHVTHIISDVTPWVLTSTKEMNIKSTLLASFTWLDIYEEFLPEKLLELFIKSYNDAQQVIFYELANPQTLKRFSSGVNVGLASRNMSVDRINEIKSEFDNTKKTIFVSVGMSNNGVYSSYDVEELPYNFITTHGVGVKGKNVKQLPIDVLDTQNYVAASDFCISKAGWTSISEMLLSKRPMALIRRDDNAEDRYLINKLCRRKQAIAIDLFELSDIGKIITKMQKVEWGSYDYQNDSDKIANLIINY
ncbi:hypothetical protein [Liquorilactobacillus hordei]|uniref:hypothetical protein n=2 Tax=Liquorilactobacillus hordei TaxID=468911 RepID=UPI0012ECC667|nr:hypothetical protein [Liquorilactobacillus hordei]QYH52208.1 hypothetical protein G6O70_06975 [Liquorilactobacillus hordei DSM 19519]